MSIKIVYFPFPGRVEPTRLALTLGGIEFEDQRVTIEEWNALRVDIAPKQLPLMHVGDKVISQSNAQLRYASQISKFQGKPLYPENAELALEVDEFVAFVGEMFGPIRDSLDIKDLTERKAFRAKAMASGGDLHKWISYVDTLLGKSKSQYAIGDHLTSADLAAFCWIQILKSRYFDGIPSTCLDVFKNINTHRQMVANIPAVKAYYAEPKMPFYKSYL